MSDVIEIALPLNVLAGRVSFFVIVERELNGTRSEIARYPARGPIHLDIPTSAFDAANWRA